MEDEELYPNEGETAEETEYERAAKRRRTTALETEDDVPAADWAEFVKRMGDQVPPVVRGSPEWATHWKTHAELRRDAIPE